MEHRLKALTPLEGKLNRVWFSSLIFWGMFLRTHACEVEVYLKKQSLMSHQGIHNGSSFYNALENNLENF